ncbi:PorP/SprF family type IX secretion system membrane protein [Sanyastnella coralliicola]|uniref:PorP/SprF family type IX secretion system membrane protein n=1 Tax=Sanyastnella coralliicola TaxID=3069118 RepID=UPI0027B94603|nr:PorP/SprF family type IX secretion system membrane protein [Longitalea sp. SCSIO 12813]
MRYQILTTLAALFIFSCVANAQQEAGHAQNLMNMLRVNPAYAGYKETAVFTAFHRSQWVGFKGAPSTQTLSFDMPIKRGKFAWGGTINHDKIGPTSELSLMMDATARVQVNRTGFMSFGLKATASMFQTNFSDVTLTSTHYDQQDDFFSNNPQSVFMPNIGFGFFYHDRAHFVSVSVPRLLENQLDKKNSDAYAFSEGVVQPTAFLMAGKIWKIDRQFKFQPTLMMRATANAPLSIGANANLFIQDTFKVGAYYYYKEVAGAFIQYEVNKKLKFGYSVDVFAHRAITTNFGSHEIMASYQLKAKRKRIVYPRYF